MNRFGMGSARVRRHSRRTNAWLAGLASLTVVAGLGPVATPVSATPQAGPGQSDGAAEVEQQVLDELADDGATEFWVYLRDQADLAAATAVDDRAAQGELVYKRLTETAEESQRDLRGILDGEGVDYQSFWIANTVQVTGDSELLDRIAALPEVEQITADRVYELPEPAPAEDEPGVDSFEWNIAAIRAPQVWDELDVRGEDIVVGSIDSGVQFDHPTLVDQYRGNRGDGEFDHNYSWHDPSEVCGSPSLEPCDGNGHGTHTTGTMVGDDGAGNQIGVAPGARWIAAKGCEDSFCSQSALLSSGQFMLAPVDLAGDNPDPALRPHIVNNSWGGDATDDPWFEQTVHAWVAAGIFPVFSAGNAGPACGTAGNPGNLPDSYAVGAFDVNNAIASFSSRGPSAFGEQIAKPDIAAPGVEVRSALPDDGYGIGSGTSMAAPHAAGTVALMWSAAPAIARDVEATRELLDLTAINVDDTSCGGTPGNNNVWGEGKLDAFAAVLESPRGPTGSLAGRVTHAVAGEPIAGATVTVTGAVDRERSTRPDGAYAFTLPIGEYAATASAFGYADQSLVVTVTTDQTTTQDFPLPAVPQVTVSGQVTDGSGHGWPLHARVTAPGTPVGTFTDPVTGDYRLSLPSNAEYTIVAEPQYPGYADAEVPVEVGEADLVLDLAVDVDPRTCHRAPGHAFDGEVAVLGDLEIPPSRELAFGEFLDANGIPSTQVDWHDDLSRYDAIIVNSPGDPGAEAFLRFLAETDAAGTGVMFLDTGGSLRFGANGISLLSQHLGNPQVRDTEFPPFAPHIFYEVVAEHPVLAGFDVDTEIVIAEPLQKGHGWFDGYEGDGRAVIAKAGLAGAGVIGSGIGVQERDTNRHVLLSLQGAVQQGGLMGAFTPESWTEDGATVFFNALEWVTTTASLECHQVDGGLVLGQVSDLNTGAGVNDVTVTSVGNPDEHGVSAGVPDDAGVEEGFYWLFSSLTGSQEFAASAFGYAGQTRTVEVAPNAVTRADFTLPAGELTVEPAQVTATVRPGQSAERSFAITNTGTAPTELELGEMSASFEAAAGEGTAPAGAQVRHIKGHFTPGARAWDDGPSDSPGAAVGAADPPAVPAAEPWTDLPDYPLEIMDNAAAVVDGKLYSFAGYAPFPGSIREDRAYVLDPQAEQWQQLANMPDGRTKPEAAAIDGLIYVVGGWSEDITEVNTAATTFIFDPAHDTWSQGADMPEGRAAPGVAVLDGQLYVVGGCLSIGCVANNNLWRYDPTSDTWEELADYPEPVSWLACAGLAGQVYCTGGANALARTTSSSTYAYHPGQDRWTQVADYSVGSVEVTMVVREPVSCDVTITGAHVGPLQVTDGVTCVADGARVVGPTTVRAGGGLVAGGATFTGPVTATGAGVVEFADTRLTGPVTVRDTTGSVLLSGVRVTGPVRLVDNATGDVPIIVAGNRVTGPLACTGNEPPPVNEGEPNTVTGPRSGQCARL